MDLTEKSLLEEAVRNTGLTDFGDDVFREGLCVLLDSLEGEARLHDFGRLFAHKEILRHLENRLRVTEDWKRYPEMAEVEIVAPIFVVSLPRSGSTILHELLAQDPTSRFVATWECNLVSPPAEAASYESDPRIAEWEREIARTHGSEVPDFEGMHPMGARLPEECLTVMALDFKSQVFAYQFNVPSYEAWLEQQDLHSVYATHRRQLQYMQWRCPRERWVLKAVGHLWALEEIFDVYPDARVVQTHRDPLKVLPSLTSLLSMGLGMTTDAVDAQAIAMQWAESWVEALRKALAFRSSGSVDEKRFFDVHYLRSVDDPVAMVGRIYAHFGISLSEEARRRMRDFLALSPKDKHGVHHYSLEEFGLDPAAERERYRFYTESFGVEAEIQV
ncbi:MAG: sulfotransferase [Deltaproteobacteria bacterium]|nr:sulfotransferase [Deltaproteobacteria bacterium]